MSVIDFADVRIGGRRMQQARGPVARLARQDPAVFAQFVLRHERTGKGIRLAPMHKVWHDLLGKYDRFVIWSHIEGGKTNQMSIARVLWEVGRDPSLRVLVLSGTHGQATKIISSLATYIESSAELHAVFPDLVPTRRTTEPWKPLSGQLTIKRSTVSKDATVTASGVHGSILGARYDLIILDDVLNAENTHTVEARKGLIEWLQSTVQSRLTAQGRFYVIGTAWHPEDALHHYAKLFCSGGEQRALQYPVVDDEGRPRWPEAWPLERIDRQRREFTPAEFARTMLCRARDDSESKFKRDWVDVAIARGASRKMQSNALGLTAGARTYTGVDLAVQKHAAADLTVFFTIAVHGDGTRELLEILAGRWSGPEILGKVLDVHRRFASVVTIENVSAQDFIAQFTRHVSAVPLRTFTTGRGQASLEFQAEHLAAEMANGKWIIPSLGGLSREVQAWIDELLYYDPRGHCGDRLAACLFARHGAMLGSVKAETGRLDLFTR